VTSTLRTFAHADGDVDNASKRIHLVEFIGPPWKEGF